MQLYSYLDPVFKDNPSGHCYNLAKNESKIAI